MRRFDKRKNIMESSLRLEREFINRNKSNPSKKIVSLTIEEKNSIIEMVLKSDEGVVINESNYYDGVSENIKLNLEYYTQIKEIFKTPDGLLTEGGFLSIMGNVKDAMTVGEKGGKIIDWLKSKIESVVEYFSNKFNQYAPESVKKGVDWVKNAGKKAYEWLKWMLEIFHYKSFARFFAMIKFKTMKPTQEQKDCMMMLAKKVYVSILISLVIFYLIKVGPAVITFLTIKGGAAVSTASLTPLILPFATLLTKAGATGAAKIIGSKAFSAYSAASKTKSAVKKSREIDDKEEKYELDETGVGILKNIKNEFKEYFTGWSKAWNKCKDMELDDVKQISPTGEKNAEIIASEIGKSMKGLGTDEDSLLLSLRKMSSNHEFKQLVLKIFKSKFGKNLVDVVKSELSGNDLKQALNSINRKSKGWNK